VLMLLVLLPVCGGCAVRMEGRLAVALENDRPPASVEAPLLAAGRGNGLAERFGPEWERATVFPGRGFN